MPIRLPKTKGMLRREAASWLARLEGRDGRANPAFRRWYEADPRHVEAFDRVRGNYEKAGLLRESELASAAPVSPAGDPSRRPRYALAAALAVVMLVPASLLALKSLGAPPFTQTQALYLSTRAGEIKSVSLDDGTTLTVHSQSAVQVTIDDEQRIARLERGRIRLDIEADEMPFTVAAGSTEVRASDALIDVELRGDDVRGQVHRGRASVHQDESGAKTGSGLEVAAGEAFESEASGAVRKTGESPTDGASIAMFEFDAAPLAEAVAASNRHSRTKLVVADDMAASVRVTGAFRVGDVAGLAKALGDTFRLTVDRTNDGNYLLSPGTPSGVKKKRGG